MSLWNDLFILNEAPSSVFPTNNEFEADGSDNAPVQNIEDISDDDLQGLSDDDFGNEFGDEQNDMMSGDMAAEGDPSMGMGGPEGAEGGFGEDPMGDPGMMEPEEQFTPEEKDRRLFLYKNIGRIIDICNTLNDNCYEAKDVDTFDIVEQTNKLKDVLSYYKDYKFDIEAIEKHEKIIKDSMKVMQKLIANYKAAVRKAYPKKNKK